MRPIGRFFCCVIALTACVATGQNNEIGYPKPTIHNSGQRATAVPLPALPSSNAPAPTHPTDAAWFATPSATSNGVKGNVVQAGAIQSGTTQGGPTQNGVTQANYVALAANSSADQPAAKRTPLNSKRSDTLLTEGKRTGNNTLQMLFSVGSSLLIVIGLFLGVAWCYRKTLNTSMGGIPKQVVSVLGRTAIAPRQQLILVRFGSKLVLVSMNQGETRAISEITDPIEVDQLAGSCESHQPHSLTNSFRTILNQSGGAV